MSRPWKLPLFHIYFPTIYIYCYMYLCVNKGDNYNTISHYGFTSNVVTLYVSFQIFHIYIYFSIVQSELKVLTEEKRGNPHTVSEHFQAVWNTERLIHFISKHFVKKIKKRKSADQRITFISVQYSHCQNMKIWKGFDFFLRHDFIINVGHIIKKISTCLNLYFNKFFIVIYHWFFSPKVFKI